MSFLGLLLIVFGQFFAIFVQSQFLHCQSKEERRKEVIYGSVWYKCEKKKQVMKGCLVCTAKSSETAKYYINQKTLEYLKGKSLGETANLEDFCNREIAVKEKYACDKLFDLFYHSKDIKVLLGKITPNVEFVSNEM